VVHGTSIYSAETCSSPSYPVNSKHPSPILLSDFQIGELDKLADPRLPSSEQSKNTSPSLIPFVKLV
jgi:hypothetical protein